MLGVPEFKKMRVRQKNGLKKLQLKATPKLVHGYA